MLRLRLLRLFPLNCTMAVWVPSYALTAAFALSAAAVDLAVPPPMMTVEVFLSGRFATVPFLAASLSANRKNFKSDEDLCSVLQKMDKNW